MKGAFPDYLAIGTLLLVASCFAWINYKHSPALSRGRRVLAALVVTAALIVPWTLVAVMFTYIVRMSAGLPE
jgi:hypothetical protein